MKAYQKDLIFWDEFYSGAQTSTFELKDLHNYFSMETDSNDSQVRQRLQKIFFDSISDPAAYKSARDLAVTKLETLARSNKLSINGSINAALFLGELKEKTGQLVQTATEPLSRLVTDESITPAVRIAALLGLGSRTKEARESTERQHSSSKCREHHTHTGKNNYAPSRTVTSSCSRLDASKKS